MYKEAHYVRLRGCLDIPQHAIDFELARQPMLVMDATEITSEARSIADDEADKLKIITAQAADKLRQENIGDYSKPKFRSETAVASEQILDEDVQNQMTIVNNTKGELSLWQALVEALRSKEKSMQTIGQLMNTGWISKDAVYASSREDLARRRQEKKG